MQRRNKKAEKQAKLARARTPSRGEFDYLLVEYLKRASNETSFLLLIITSLLFFVLINLFPASLTSVGQNVETIRLVFVILILGGFAMFGKATLEKRDIEKKLLQITRAE